MVTMDVPFAYRKASCWSAIISYNIIHKPFLHNNNIYSKILITHAGTSVNTANGGHVHTFLYDTSDPVGPRRTSAQISEHARQAIGSGTTVYMINKI